MNLHRILACLAVVGAVAVSTPTTASAAGRVGLIGPGRLVLTQSTDGAMAKLTLSVEASVPAALSLEVTDVVTDGIGNRQSVPAGSTSYGLASQVRVDPGGPIQISPESGRQVINFTLQIPSDALDRPRIGILHAMLVPTDSSGSGGITVQQGAGLETVIVSDLRQGVIPDSKPAMESAGLSIARVVRSPAPFDAILPDAIPGLIDHGPIEVVSRVRNSGKMILNVQTAVQFSSVGPGAIFSGSDPGRILRTVNLPAHSALPGQVSADSTTSDTASPDGAAGTDSLPWLGLVRVTATTTGKLGPLASEPVVQSTTFLVAPWKEGLVVLLAIGLLIWLRVWQRKKAIKGARRVATRGKGNGSGTTAAASSATLDSLMEGPGVQATEAAEPPAEPTPELPAAAPEAEPPASQTDPDNPPEGTSPPPS